MDVEDRWGQVISTMIESGWLENGFPFRSQSGQVFPGSWGQLVGASTGRGGQMSHTGEQGNRA